MRWFMWCAVLLGLSGVSGESLAHVLKTGELRVTPSLSAYKTRTAHRDLEGDPSYGGSLTVDGDVDSNGNVEVSLVYLDKLYALKSGESVLAERIPRMHVTFGYRHWFAPWVSTGLAFYSAYSMGEAKVIRRDNTEDLKFKTTAREIAEYGFDVSLQWEPWSNDTVAALVDARYSLSTSHKAREDADLYRLSLGVKYLIPKRS